MPRNSERTTRWVRVNCTMLDGPKFGGLSPLAFKCWVVSLAWAAKWETGGLLPDSPAHWRRVGDGRCSKRVIAELIERGVMEPFCDPGAHLQHLRSGYLLTNFETHVVAFPKPSAKHKRKPIGTRARYDVLRRDGFRCNSCGRHAKRDGVVLHVDHIHAVSKGGTNALDNLQALCEDCNLGKAAR